MKKQVYSNLVARVAILEGGVERLAVLLHVSPSVVRHWVHGFAPIPPDVYVRCIDYLLDHHQRRDVRPSASEPPDQRGCAANDG